MKRLPLDADHSRTASMDRGAWRFDDLDPALCASIEASFDELRRAEGVPFDAVLRGLRAGRFGRVADGPEET